MIYGRRENISDCFAYGYPSGCSSVVYSNGGTLTHCHGFTLTSKVIFQCDSDIAYWNLPWAYELILCDQTADRSIADMYEEGFVGNGGKS